MTKSSKRRGESKVVDTQQSATVAVNAASVQLSEDGHVPKKDKAPRKLPKSDDGTTSDDDGRATRKLKKEKCAISERVEIKDKKAKKEKTKTEAFHEGPVDLHRGEADNSENAKEPDKRAKRRKAKVEVGNSEDLQVENNSAEHGEDATPDGKSKKKKRKKTGLESGGASDPSAPKQKTEHEEIEDRNAERKKLKVEVLNEGAVDLHRGDADNPESAEEPDKRAKRRKQKGEVENDSSERVEDATPDGKTKKKKRKKTGLENDGASNQSSHKKKPLQAGPSDQGEDKVAKVKKARKKKKNRKAPPEATKNTKDQCLQYLKDWQGPSWKFCKNKQLWLLSHAFEEDMIPEDDFEILLRYIEGLKGAARERLQQSANKFLEKANEDNDEDVDIDAGKYERARLVLQMLD